MIHPSPDGDAVVDETPRCYCNHGIMQVDSTADAFIEMIVARVIMEILVYVILEENKNLWTHMIVFYVHVNCKISTN